MYIINGFWAFKVRCTQCGFCEHGDLQEYKGNILSKSGGVSNVF